MATDVTSRPFAGNWEPNLRKIVRHTPDALVYINGDTGIPGCASCGGRVDIQPFITGVSCEPSTNPIATATISLSIPKYRSAGLFADGKFALKPGMEVHIYYRGYFPASNLLSTAGADATPSEAMYPYYLVFHGVVTSNGYSYSGGEYTATLSCSDLLHFWQYMRLAAQGSILANKPSGSKVTSSWLGHNFSGMSPYSIMYTLYRDVFGAAGGVETNWLGAETTNAAAVSSQTGESQFSLSILFWQKRFSQTVANLRMFGATGRVYNAAQAAFLANLTSDQVKSLAKNYAAAEGQSAAKDPNSPLQRAARAVGYDPYSILATGGGSADDTDTLGTSVAALQAYVSDVSKWGTINMLETEYLTKLEIANAVTHETGFEFYQDVDGDLVFKPPFYNMDTSELRVYRIEPEDVISFDVQEKEPDCTTIKWTGGHMSNLRVSSLEGEFGKRAEYIDYRLVAQFGWRQETLDSAYYDNSDSAYYALLSKMDIYNIAVKSGSVTIPLRPELRPGYPVYIVHLDCFFYCTGISHSFQFGGSCQSTLTLVGKRSKFHAPGKPPVGRLATVSDVRMDNMHLPPLPLTLPAGAVAPQSTSYATGEPSDPRLQTAFVNAYRKTQGFPNVVMALDPALVNPLQFARSFDLETLETEQGVRNLIKAVVMGGSGVIQRPPDDQSTADEKTKSFDGPWVIQVSNNEWIPLPSVSELMAAARSVRQASSTYAGANVSYRGLDAKTDAASISKVAQELVAASSGLISAVDQATAVFGRLVEAARNTYERGFPGAGTAAATLELLSDFKSSFAPGKNLPGYYRYYSSAHPDSANQGMLRLALDSEGRFSQSPGVFTMRGRATQFSRDGNALVEGDVTAGIPIAAAGGQVVVKATHEIRSFDLARIEVTVAKNRVVQQGNLVQAFPKKDLADALRGYFLEQILDADDYGPSKKVADYKTLFETERNRIADIIRDPSRIPPPLDVPDDVIAPPDPYVGTSFSINVLENGGASPYITSGFSPPGTTRKVDFADGSSQNRAHKGVDLRAREPGVLVLAAAPGRVFTATSGFGPRPPSGYGNWIAINHEDGFQTRYAHLSQVIVAEGATVNAGQQIGVSGNSGTEAFHLHFELLLNGENVDPVRYVPSGNTFVPSSAPPPVSSPVVATQAAAPTVFLAAFNTDYSNGLRAIQMPATAQNVSGLPGNDDNSKAVALASMLANAIAGPAAQALTLAVSSSDVSWTNASLYAAAWAEMFPENSVLTPVLRDGEGKVIANDGKRTYHAPVFPVSDERGYEVVGTYPYGRGLKITDQSLGQLLGPTGELPNYDAVDQFIKLLISSDGSTASVAQALGASNLDAVTKAEIAAGMDPALLRDSSIAQVLKDVVPGRTGAGANSPASTAQGIGVFSPVNVAYGLSDMAVGDSGSCQCFAHQADIQLLRDPIQDDQFIVIEGTQDAFTDYVRTVAATKTVPWAAAQDNYRGNTVAVGAPTGVAAAYDREVEASRSRVNAARAGLDRTVDELRRNT